MERPSELPPPRAPDGANADVTGDEEIRRIAVDDEDRLAFRVGVNILSLIALAVVAYLVWRNFFR